MLKAVAAALAHTELTYVRICSPDWSRIEEASDIFEPVGSFFAEDFYFFYFEIFLLGV